MANPISYIDVKLPVAPATTDPELYKELLIVYNALSNLVAGLSEVYGQSIAFENAVAVPSGSVFNLLTLNLPSGAWAVAGGMIFIPEATTRIYVHQYSLATPSEVFHPLWRQTNIYTPNPIVPGNTPVGGGSALRNLYLTDAGTINLAGYASYDTAGMTAYGWLTAKRALG